MEPDSSSTQKYEYVELYRGTSQDLRLNTNLDFSHQPQTDLLFILFKGKETSTFMIRRLRLGISKNGVPWKKWEMWGKVSISCRAIGNSAPKLNLYGMHRNRPGNDGRWQPFQNITPRSEMLQKIVPQNFIKEFNTEVERLYTENIGNPSFSAKSYSDFHMGNPESKTRADPFAYASHLAYPLMRELRLNNKRQMGTVVSGISGAMRSSNIMEMTKTLYGSSNYRKDLVRAVAGSTFMTMAITSQFKNLVPVDWIIKMIQEFSGKYSFDLNTAERMMIKPFFKALTETQKKRLFNSMYSGHYRINWAVAETLRMFGMLYRDHNVRFIPGQLEGRSWHEIHDVLMTDLEIRGAKEEPIKKVKLAKKIAEIPASDDFALVLPETTTELITWGKEMRHCIGSYANTAVRGENVFIGIMKNGKMIGNAQINVSAKSVVQIFGKHNRVLDEAIRKEFSDTLISRNILSEQSFKNAHGWH